VYTSADTTSAAVDGGAVALEQLKMGHIPFNDQGRHQPRHEGWGI